MVVVEESQVLVSGLPPNVLEDRLGNQADVPRLGHALGEDLTHGSQLLLMLWHHSQVNQFVRIALQIVEFFRRPTEGKGEGLLIVQLPFLVQTANDLHDLLAILVLAGLGMWNVRHEVADVLVTGVAHATQDVDRLVAAVPSRKNKFQGLVVRG